MDKEFGLKFSFDIDDGELNDFDTEEAFVLGFAFGEIYTLLQESGRGFEKIVNMANKERIEKACKTFGRDFNINHISYDRSETWGTLTVFPAKDQNDGNSTSS